MRIVESARRFNHHPLGRAVLALVGVAAVYWSVTRYPPLGPVLRWTFPALLVLWGASRLYFHGVSEPLTVVAGCLLVLGGLSLALFQLVPLSELAGAVANLVSLAGIIAELYAHHYRERVT